MTLREIEAAALDPSVRLQLARRADWRFLLPDPMLGRVLVLGAVDRELVSALHALAIDVEHREGCCDEPTEHFDVVVATAPQVSLASRCVAPGGWLYVEVEHRGVADRLPGPARRVASTLERLGFEDVRLSWHWPSFVACAEIVPLGDRTATALALRRRQSGRGSRGKAVVAAMIDRVSLLDRAASCVSVRGRAANGAERAGTDFVTAYLEENGARLGLGRFGLHRPFSSLALTPRFHASRHVVFLVASAGESRPSIVVKVARLPGAGSGVEREAAVLLALQGARTQGVDTVPALVALDTVGDVVTLVETAIVGEPLTARRVRSDPVGWAARVESWLRELPRVSVARPETPLERHERLVAQPLAAFAREARDPEATELVSRTLELLAPLRSAELPQVVEHGDVGHPNLLLLPDGRIGAVDWELAELSGLPGHDLTFFLAFAASAVRAAAAPDEHVRAFEEAFFAPGAWALPILAEHASRFDIEPAFVRLLAIASLARYTAGIPDRVGGGSAAGRAWAVGSKHYRLWRHVVENAHRLARDEPRDRPR